MPRFYYDIHHDGIVQKDAEGIELDNLQRARHEAIRTLGEVALEKFAGGVEPRQLSIAVFDEAGRRVLNVTMHLTIDQPDG